MLILIMYVMHAVNSILNFIKYVKNMLKQSTTTHEREMSHIEDTQTMNMMVRMVNLNSEALKT